MKSNIIAILFLAVLSSLTNASEEDFLEWTSAKLALATSKEAGETMLEASVSQGKWKEFVLTAFSKEFRLSEDQLAKLEGFPLSSITATHEAGYESIGGYFIYFHLDYLYATADRVFTENKIVVSFNRKGIRLTERASKPLNGESQR
jgi:hypothetical protein